MCEAISKLGSFLGVPRFTAKVSTGDRRYASTNAPVWMHLVDSTGNSSEKTHLDNILVDDHKRGKSYLYNVNYKGLNRPDDIAYITVWRTTTGDDEDSWYLDKIELEDLLKKKTYIFPVHRWIKEDKQYHLYEFDAFLPQDDKQKEIRKAEVERKRKVYEYMITVKNGPKQINNLPEDENYSEAYMNNIESSQVVLLKDPNYAHLTTGNWETLEDVSNSYRSASVMGIPEQSIKYWREDRWFGRQRVQGMNPVLIELCKEIPSKLGVSPTDLEPFLEGLKLSDALNKNKIFIVDLELLHNAPCKPIVSKLVAPIGLFYLNKKNELMPIAIQQFQEKSPTNPVFFPNDPKNIWLLAKMFFNMAEAQHHQSCTHLGLTHMVIESMCVAANRHMSQSHPIFRLMAPHFIYLIPLNLNGIKKLIIPGGFFDQAMTLGRVGALELIGRRFQKWRLDVDGNFEEQLKKRGVMDPNVLPYYPYRDDGVPLYKLIRKYVTNVVKFFYNTPEKLAGDHEVQGWVKEMATPLEEGCGFLGMPEKLTTVEQLVDIVTAVISICSMGHAAANFLQYEAYAFLPNYPVVLTKLPPQTKKEITEKELMEYIPPKNVTLGTMVLTKVLSTKSTKSLGDFEVQYLYNPEVVKIADDFRKELKELSKITKEKNQKREFPYEWLDPAMVPNSISI